MMAITAYAALWFFPFVLPLCLYTAFTDMREMRITNQTVIALALVFLVIGPIALPFETYLWHILYMVVVLIVCIVLNGAGAMGAGDAKFIAAATPFIALGDMRLLMAIAAANLLGAWATHRIAKHTPLRKIAPHWKSWDDKLGKKFPMGLALGSTLAIYLGLGTAFGS
jgi:prepilin peptidase CpaA